MMKENQNFLINMKNKIDSDGAESNRLSINYDIYSRKKYLNVSIHKLNCCAGMAERITQLTVNQCPSGCVGSSPTAGAAEIFDESINEINIEVKK